MIRNKPLVVVYTHYVPLERGCAARIVYTTLTILSRVLLAMLVLGIVERSLLGFEACWLRRVIAWVRNEHIHN